MYSTPIIVLSELEDVAHYTLYTVPKEHVVLIFVTDVATSLGRGAAKIRIHYYVSRIHSCVLNFQRMFLFALSSG